MSETTNPVLIYVALGVGLLANTAFMIFLEKFSK